MINILVTILAFTPTIIMVGALMYQLLRVVVQGGQR